VRYDQIAAARRASQIIWFGVLQSVSLAASRQLRFA
jgi:hypothetical protein